MRTQAIGIAGEHIQLRALSQEDLPQLLRWENDPEGWYSNGTINPLSADFIQRYITSSTVHILESGTMSLIIEDLESRTSLGHLVLYDYTPIHRRLALGIYIDQAARHEGIATEALRLALRYAFDKLRCEQVYAEVLASNEASQHMLRSLGFEHTATLPRWHWHDTHYEDLYYYQIWHP